MKTEAFDSLSDDLARDQAHLIHPMHDAALVEEGRVWVAGRGAVLVDAQRREYLDALSGLWNVLAGYGRKELVQAAADQMRALCFASLYSGGTHRPAIALAERLAGLCYRSINRFFFTTSGAEAVEAAIKTARYFWKAAGEPTKTKIVALTHAYHGLTSGAMAAMGLPSYWLMFEPRMPGMVHVDSPYPYRFRLPAQSSVDCPQPPALPGGNEPTIGELAADLLEQAMDQEGAETVAAFLAEPVQVAGGTIVPPADYWPRIREICMRRRILLIADEVVTAFGRTGPWFALSRYGIEPDIVTFAKGLSSGYFPMGGMGVSDTIAEAIDRGRGAQLWAHGSTNSGHPVGCAVALANLDLLEREGLFIRAADLGARLLRGLKSLETSPNVGDVRGLGFLAAVELVADKRNGQPFPAELAVGRRVYEAAARRGMVTRMRGDIYQFAPPYVTSEAQIDRMVEILGEAIREVLPRL